VFIEAKDDGGGGDNWTTGAISRKKLQSNHRHQQTNIQLVCWWQKNLTPAILKGASSENFQRPGRT